MADIILALYQFQNETFQFHNLALCSAFHMTSSHSHISLVACIVASLTGKGFPLHNCNFHSCCLVGSRRQTRWWHSVQRNSLKTQNIKRNETHNGSHLQRVRTETVFSRTSSLVSHSELLIQVGTIVDMPGATLGSRLAELGAYVGKWKAVFSQSDKTCGSSVSKKQTFWS